MNKHLSELKLRVTETKISKSVQKKMSTDYFVSCHYSRLIQTVQALIVCQNLDKTLFIEPLMSELRLIATGYEPVKKSSLFAKKINLFSKL